MTHSDAFGRTCAFYNRFSVQRPELCLLPWAQENCKLTCGLQKCVNHKQSLSAYYLWDGIKHVVPHSANGSICLNDRVRPSPPSPSATTWFTRETLTATHGARADEQGGGGGSVP
jgi:hypothetical protein